MSDAIVWIHGDCLSPDNPALLAHPGAPAIFVFDDEVLERYRVTLKRIGFIYECLLELPVTIRRGDPAAEAVAFAREHGAARVVTSWSPSPGFAAVAGRIERDLPLEALPDPAFVPDRRYDLGRFSRYWRDASAPAMRPTRKRDS